MKVVKFTCELVCACGFTATITDSADFEAMEKHINRCKMWSRTDSATKDLAVAAMKALGGDKK
ncbi:MAG: hypothetical protein QXJ74_05255 [Nitrososphaera sp.]